MKNTTSIIITIATLLMSTGCQTTTNSSKITPIYPAGAPKISSDFNSWIGPGGGRRYQVHKGIDINGPVGQEILAIHDGIVLKAVTEKCWGPTIAVKHGWRFVALYGHVGEMLVAKGDKVKRGQVIARLGNNRYKFRCAGIVNHLHLQIGQDYNDKPHKNYWGGAHFLYNDSKGDPSPNPHSLWADGIGKITCFEKNKKYKVGTITYPVPCNK